MKKVMSTFWVALASSLTIMAADSRNTDNLKAASLTMRRTRCRGGGYHRRNKLSAVTDLDGFFSFANLSSGNHI